MLTASSAIFLLATKAYLSVRMVYKRKLASQKTASPKSGLDLTLVVAVVIGQIVLPALAIFSPWLHGADLPAWHPAVTWLGATLMAAGVYLFWRSHADLGKQWSVTLELERDHQLVTTGVYRHVRHPMYASFFLMALGQLALLHNSVAGPAALLAVTVLYAVRKPREEAMLLAHFGEGYRSYMQQAGGVLPRV